VSNTTKPWYVGFGGTSTAFTKTEASRFARDLLQSDEYRASLQERIKNKSLSPAVEVMLWHYGFGKPPETVEIIDNRDTSQLTPSAMREMAEIAVNDLREAEEVEAAVEDLARRQTPSRVM
jgi:hypothetical protein